MVKTLKKRTTKETPVSSPISAQTETLPAPGPAVETVTESSGVESLSRLSFAIEDGKINWDSMREKTREQLKNVFSATPNLLKELGLEEKEAKKPEIFSEKWVGSLYDAVSTLEIIAAVKVWKIDGETAKKFLTYSAEEKAVLAPMTAAVINKYASDWMIRFRDEIALGVIFFSITSAKVTMMRAVLEMQEKQAAKSATSATPLVVNTTPTEAVA